MGSVQRNNRNAGLDVLRAFAILGVLTYHVAQLGNVLPETLQSIAGRGWAGVDLFFVLSGFLVGGQMTRLKPGVSRFEQSLQFWLRRWTRTVPLYAVVLFAYTVIKPRLFHVEFVGGVDWKWFMFLQNLGPIKDFGQTWSLAIEEQFYFAFPLIAFAIGRMRPTYWLLPMLVSMGSRAWLCSKLQSSHGVALTPQEYFWTFRTPTWCMLDSISAGVFLAQTHSVWSKWSVQVKKILGASGVSLLLVVLTVIPEFPSMTWEIVFFYPLLAAGFSGALVCLEGMEIHPSMTSVLQPIALCSYSAYLLHQIFVRLLARQFSGPWGTWYAVGYLPAVLALSWLSYQLIELPGIDLRRRISPWIARVFGSPNWPRP